MAFNAITRAVQYRNPQRVAGLSCSPCPCSKYHLAKMTFLLRKYHA